MMMIVIVNFIITTTFVQQPRDTRKILEHVSNLQRLEKKGLKWREGEIKWPVSKLIVYYIVYIDRGLRT